MPIQALNQATWLLCPTKKRNLNKKQLKDNCNRFKMRTRAQTKQLQSNVNQPPTECPNIDEKIKTQVIETEAKRNKVEQTNKRVSEWAHNKQIKALERVFEFETNAAVRQASKKKIEANVKRNANAESTYTEAELDAFYSGEMSVLKRATLLTLKGPPPIRTYSEKK